jgi:hypothetical protein
MKKLLLPVLLIAAGLGAGIGAGLVLAPADPDDPHGDADMAAVECVPIDQIDAMHLPPEPVENTEFVKFHNQFMVPVMKAELVDSLVVLSISLEVAPGTGELIYAREPKLRDAFLQVLFDHAGAGGFTGNFVSSVGLDSLRSALREVAVAVIGDAVQDVLIVDLVKQDV